MGGCALIRLIFVCACLAFLAGCDTDDGSDYSSSGDSGYSTDSVGSDSQPAYGSTDYADSSSSSSSYDRQAAQDQLDQERADSQADQDRQNQQTLSDLNDADQYHYNND
jgi:hypothetical protein